MSLDFIIEHPVSLVYEIDVLVVERSSSAEFFLLCFPIEKQQNKETINFCNYFSFLA